MVLTELKKMRVTQKNKVHDLYSMYQRNRLILQPPYQRGRVWGDDKRIALIDSVRKNYPIGVFLIRVILKENEDGHEVEYWEAVDAQQRATSIFEYLNGNATWTVPKRRVKATEYEAFSALTSASREEFRNADIPVELLYGYTDAEIRDIFQRVQTGAPAQIGEKVKAQSSNWNRNLYDVSQHAIFDKWGATLKRRNKNWARAGIFLRAMSEGLFIDQENEDLLKWMTDKSTHDKDQAESITEQTIRVLDRLQILFGTAISQSSRFDKQLNEIGTWSWCFSILAESIESDQSVDFVKAAAGLINYYQLRNEKNTKEEIAWSRCSSHSSRLSVGDNQECLRQLQRHMFGDSCKKWSELYQGIGTTNQQ